MFQKRWIGIILDREYGYALIQNLAQFFPGQIRKGFQSSYSGKGFARDAGYFFQKMRIG